MYSPFFQNVLLHSYCISAHTVCKCLHLSLYRMQMNEKVFVKKRYEYERSMALGQEEWHTIGQLYYNVGSMIISKGEKIRALECPIITNVRHIWVYWSISRVSYGRSGIVCIQAHPRSYISRRVVEFICLFVLLSFLSSTEVF
jgi:hypothetical protein